MHLPLGPLRGRAPPAPAPLLSLILLLAAAHLPHTPAVAAESLQPTAVRRMGLDPGEKFFPEYAGFAEWATGGGGNLTTRMYPPALPALLRRQSCPAGMDSCAAAGAPNKCCADGSYCAAVDDPSVDNVACCPDGATCAGSVGDCPDGAASCPADLGGGCCIPGYVCYGAGCIPSASAVPTTLTSTVTRVLTNDGPSTVVVVVTTTLHPALPAPATTQTSTRTVTQPAPGGNAPPYRATLTSGAAAPAPSDPYCPAGFYGCLAVHGGGCCQTDRDCATHDCPPTTYTTIIAGAATIAVPAADVPAGGGGRGCAAGWFLCADAMGCCPGGYACAGTASCSSVGAEATAEVQREQPTGGGGGGVAAEAAVADALWVALAALVGIWI